jgi:arsenite-transporting ATPase
VPTATSSPHGVRRNKVHLAQIEHDFAKLPRYKVPLQATDIQGLTALQHMATLLEQAGL